MQPRPIASARFGLRARARERRRGSSIRWWVAAVGIQEAATTARPAGDRERAPDDRREDQGRPVPEVPRVGDAADVADRREREQPGRGPLRLGEDRGPGEDQAGGAEGRQQRGGSGEGGARVEGDRRVDDRAEAGPADSRRRDAGDAHRAEQRQRRPERQLPGAAEGREVGGGGLLVGEVDAERERADQDERQRPPDRGADRAAATAPEPGGRQQQGRPDDVELLLDRQRPEMQDGARFDFLGEVVDRLGGEMPVGRVEGGADDVARDFDRAHGREEQQREGADRRRGGPRSAAAAAWRGGRRSGAARSPPVRSSSPSSSRVMRKPEMTKKTSTPT